MNKISGRELWGEFSFLRTVGGTMPCTDLSYLGRKLAALAIHFLLLGGCLQHTQGLAGDNAVCVAILWAASV